MNWNRIIDVAVWTAALMVLLLFAAFWTLMGDCPEHVISGWTGGLACSNRKHVIAWSILIGFPLLWVIGSVVIIRRGSS